MRIEFYNKETGVVLNNTDDYYFVMNNVVYVDNEKCYESQYAVVCFDDFIQELPNIGWRVVQGVH